MQHDIASITAMLEHLHHNSRARVVPEISRAHNAAVHSRSTEGNQEPEGLPARTTWPSCGSARSTCFANKQVKSHKCRIWCRIHGTARCNDPLERSEERRVGKESRSTGCAYARG